MVDPVSTILTADNVAVALAVAFIFLLVGALRVIYKESVKDKEKLYEIVERTTTTLKDLKSAIERSSNGDR